MPPQGDGSVRPVTDISCYGRDPRRYNQKQIERTPAAPPTRGTAFRCVEGKCRLRNGGAFSQRFRNPQPERDRPVNFEQFSLLAELRGLNTASPFSPLLSPVLRLCQRGIPATSSRNCSKARATLCSTMSSTEWGLV
jgi:hypothetical protein